MALRNRTLTVSVEQIYGKPLEELQRSLTGRQEFVAFGMVPDEAVQFLRIDGQVKTHEVGTDHKFGGPRLLIENRRRNRVTYEEVDGPMRAATATEWFMNRDGRIVPGPSAEPVVIMTRTETAV